MMQNLMLKRGGIRAFVWAAAMAAPLVAPAAETPGEWSFSGYFDVYFLRDTRSIGAGNSLSFRQYDLKHGELNLASALLSARRPAGGGIPFSVLLDVTAGDNNRLLHAAEPFGPKKIEWLQQAYLSFAFAGFNVDIGKFLSWIGYEGHHSADNDNYGRSFLFTAAQPAYHTGTRLTREFGGFKVGLYGVHGWNEFEDGNREKSFGASVGFSPLKDVDLNLGYFGGTEGRNTPARHNSASFGGIGLGAGKWDVHLGDAVLVYQATPQIKLAANATYATAKGKSGATGGTWAGYAAYATYDVNDQVSLGLRGETFHDFRGLRTGAAQSLSSVTATLGYRINDHSLARIEYRRDESNQNSFLGTGGTAEDSRQSWTVSYVVKF